jgi:hypothetical protein
MRIPPVNMLMHALYVIEPFDPAEASDSSADRRIGPSMSAVTMRNATTPATIDNRIPRRTILPLPFPEYCVRW